MDTNEKVLPGDKVVWDCRLLSTRALEILQDRHGKGPFEVVTDSPKSKATGKTLTASQSARHPQLLVLRKTTGDKKTLNNGFPISGFLIRPEQHP